MHVCPCPRVAAIVQKIIYQPRVTTDGDTAARRPQIRLGRDCVLLVAQMISGISEEFYERDTEIGGIALTPLRHQHRHAIEHQPAEAGVIFRQIIDLRLRREFGRADSFWFAIEIARAFDFE